MSSKASPAGNRTQWQAATMIALGCTRRAMPRRSGTEQAEEKFTSL
jgi:hypothetical protein